MDACPKAVYYNPTSVLDNPALGQQFKTKARSETYLFTDNKIIKWYGPYEEHGVTSHQSIPVKKLETHIVRAFIVAHKVKRKPKEPSASSNLCLGIKGLKEGTKLPSEVNNVNRALRRMQHQPRLFALHVKMPSRQSLLCRSGENMILLTAKNFVTWIATVIRQWTESKIKDDQIIDRQLVRFNT
jgi:hypothetical protein